MSYMNNMSIWEIIALNASTFVALSTLGVLLLILLIWVKRAVKRKVIKMWQPIEDRKWRG